MLQYHLVSTVNGESITVLLDGDLRVADESHPSFPDIKDAVTQGADADEVRDLFDVGAVLNRKFQRVSERVSVADGSVLFDGDAVDNSLSAQILRFSRAGHDFSPLVNFMENIEANPVEHSRKQLFDWLRDRDFTITEDGSFLAYKGVSDGHSVWSGNAIVDGHEVTGRIPNEVGSVIEMPRSQVQHDPGVGCSRGLHVATLEFASNYGDEVLLVKVNPRDVVSVPTDSNAQKVRTCRYEVVERWDNPEPNPEPLFRDDLGVPDWVNEPEGVDFDYDDDGWDDGFTQDAHERDEGPASVVFDWFIPSDSNPGHDYLVEKWSTGAWTCTCNDYRFRNRECKHISRAKVRDVRGV